VEREKYVDIWNQTRFTHNPDAARDVDIRVLDRAEIYTPLPESQLKLSRSATHAGRRFCLSD
jgi:hypothetical protein